MKPLLTVLLLLTSLALPAARPAGPEPVEGVDYVRIEAGAWDPRPGRIEVVEIFGYTCPHCAHFEPRLRQWHRRQGKDVDLVPVPVAFGGTSDAWARVYFASVRLGVAGRTHPAVFEALHERGSLPRNPTPQELSDFFAGFGIEPERFRATLADPEVQSHIDKARTWLRQTGLEGTPTLVVNGRWRVAGRSFEDTLRTTEWLIARERAAARAAASQTSR
ncbi:thiol:disulfide interchange protein DsbA/DsbL [Pseudoxanthomonas taiwanensis]|uniref:Thiol:disulfide interchange protein n=1 Tax=Pseudoxanthomonas taiwanensis TaxID=176598 RepID=A0A921TGY2_9GAMM|nr:thiol:disulfide interchange protein DsbA/DsbL [Pseudoxanthomonas taiwanensis]KAF1690668.1 disulfide bond formation protein DsbA [Pseudoxanthomonas taiwanensis]